MKGIKTYGGITIGALSLVAEQASATLPTAISDGFTTATSNFNDLLAAATPYVVAVAVGIVLVRLARRFLKQA